MSKVFMIGLLIVLLQSLAHSNEDENVLSDLQWQARVLLVFSPDRADPRSIAFADALSRNSCAVNERDIVSGYIVPGTTSRIADVSIGAEVARDLGNRFGIGSSEFRILLIGKDGGVKARYAAVPSLDTIFAVIDGMPMRRREAMAQDSRCRSRTD